MDLPSFFYSFLPAIAAYFVAAILGAFVLPLFFAPERLVRFISGITENELSIRDKILFPFTRVFVRLGVHPNVITIIGVVLVAWLMAAFLREATPATIFILTITAGFTDMIDGPVARAAGQVTVAGGILDLLRDMMLIVVVSVGVIIYGLVDLRMFIWFSGVRPLFFFLRFGKARACMNPAGLLAVLFGVLPAKGNPLLIV